MKIKSKLLFLVATALFVLPLAVGAAFIVNDEGDSRTNEPIEGDLYIAGDQVSVTDAVRDDVFAAGNQVSVRSNVGADVFAVGNSVRVEGSIGDDIMVVGNTVTIIAQSADDVFAAGNLVEVTDNSLIRGSVYAAGSTITLGGIINGDVYVAGSDITVKSGAHIKGNLRSFGENEPILEDGVQLDGERIHQEKTVEAGMFARQAALSGFVMSVLWWFVVALVLLYGLRGLAGDVLHNTLKNSGRSLLVGVLWWVLVLPVSFFLLLTVVGLPLAVLLLGVCLVLFVATGGYLTMVVGVWTLTRLTKHEMQPAWQHLLLGSLVVQTVGLVPVIGWALTTVIAVLVFGALTLALKKRLSATGEVS